MPSTTAPDRVVCPRCDRHSLPGTLFCSHCQYAFRMEWHLPTNADAQELDTEKPDSPSLRATGFVVFVFGFISGMVTLALILLALRP